MRYRGNCCRTSSAATGWPDDFSLYLHRPSATDPGDGRRPARHLLCLALVPHLDSGTDWRLVMRPFGRHRSGVPRSHRAAGPRRQQITAKVTTPLDFRQRLAVLRARASVSSRCFCKAPGSARTTAARGRSTRPRPGRCQHPPGRRPARVPMSAKALMRRCVPARWHDSAPACAGGWQRRRSGRDFDGVSPAPGRRAQVAQAEAAQL